MYQAWLSGKKKLKIKAIQFDRTHIRTRYSRGVVIIRMGIKTTMIKMLRTLMDKVDNMQEQIVQVKWKDVDLITLFIEIYSRIIAGIKSQTTWQLSTIIP